MMPIPSLTLRVPRPLLACLVAIMCVAVGCNRNRNVTVTGTVLRNGQPIPLSRTGVVQITLMPDVGPDEPYTTYVGRADEAGKFEIYEVAPGRYKIGIEQLDPNPQTDKLNAAFAYGNSKFVRQIDGKAPINIDLAKPDSSK
jgi:hypothetical protein